MKIAIINQHSSNFGDDAAGVSLIDQILEQIPDAEVDIVYKKKQLDGDRIPVHNERVKHRMDLFLNEKDLFSAIAYLLLPKKLFLYLFGAGRVAQHVDVLASMDAVLVSPCGANIGRYRDKLFLFRVMIAVREADNVIFCLNSIGKSGSFLYDWIAKRFLKRCKLFVREKRSYASLCEWRLFPTLGVDTAFSMSINQIANARSAYAEGNFVAFVPTFSLGTWHPDFRGYGLSDEFNSIHAALARFAVNNRLRVIIVPHLHGKEQEASLLAWSQEELKKGGAEALIATDVLDPFIYAHVLGRAKLIVTMRYHGMVLSGRMGRPFVGISYENKMKEVAEYCGMGGQTVDLRGVSEANLSRLLEDTSVAAEDLAEVLQSKRITLERLARQPVDWLVTFS